MIKSLIELNRRMEAMVVCGNNVVASAVAQNSWFSEGEIVEAVAAIRNQMLEREKLEGWLSHYGVEALERRTVLVVMAGNIPMVGFFDLLCVVCCGYRAVVKYSHKDRALMEWVVAQLCEIDPSIEIVEQCDYSGSLDGVIATGGDDAARYFASKYHAVPSIIRGSRHSVAVLSGAESRAEMALLGRDIFAYSGLGCRNVSMIFVPRGVELSAIECGATNPKYGNNYRATKAKFEVCNITHIDLGCAVAVESDQFSNSLSCLSVNYYDSLEQVEGWLAQHEHQIQCVVSNLPLNFNRVVALGMGQSPALEDYPDDVDVMQFLVSL